MTLIGLFVVMVTLCRVRCVWIGTEALT